jgi:ABC-type lipoprotein release transport system permease subunit
MWKNNFKIAWRSFKTDKFYSIVSILGLVLGMTSSLIIGLWVVHELSFNDFFPDGDRIYQVKQNSLFNGEISTSTMTPAPLAEVLKNEVAQVEYAVKYANWGPRLLLRDQNHSIRENGIYASDDFFHIFKLSAVAGDPIKALASRDQVVITQRTAIKLFDGSSALGETIMMEDNDGKLKPYVVGAVIEDMPLNSSVQLDWVINFKEIEQPWMHWGNTSYSTWVKLAPNTGLDDLELKTKPIYAKHSDFKETYPVYQPLQDVHLYEVYEKGKSVSGRIATVRHLALVGILVLLVSCINFISLVTARASIRGKEIGIRKVIGADRKKLTVQFACESFMVSTLSLCITLLLTSLILPVFNAYFHMQLLLNWVSMEFWMLILGVWLSSTLISSLYPSFYLSGMPVFSNLKDQVKPGMSGVYFRKILIVFQFFISALFIVGMIVIYKQLDYVRQKNLGIERENVLYMPLEGDLYHNMDVFRQEIIKSPAVVASTFSTSLPINIQMTSGDLSWPGKDPNLQTRISATWVGYDFLSTMGISLVGGREFSPLHPSDTLAYMVNQTALDLMGLEDPIGAEITFWNGSGPIIGVMEDFHLESLHSPIKPLVLVLDPLNSSYVFVRVKEGGLNQALADLKQVTENFNPNYPFEYHFLDQDYERLYQSDQMVSRLIFIFGLVSVFISSLGLLGLIAFTASRRIKEIGIRKVLGATVPEITVMLSKSYLNLIMLGWLIAMPISWLVLRSWLDNFSYRIELEWWYFVLAGVLTLIISLLTVSYQSIRAAMMKPVESLRTE